MAQGLTLPTFVTKPTDELLVVDAYAQTTAAQNKTSVKDIMNGGTGLTSLGSLPMGLKPEIASIGLKLPEDLAAQAKDALSVATGQSSALMSAFNSMTASTKDAVLGGISKDLISATGLGKATATVGSSVSKIASTDLTSLKGLGTLVGGLSNAPYALKLTDPKSFSAVTSNILKQATIKGLPDAFKTFSSGVSDDSVLGRVTKDLLPTVVSTSNVNTLYNMATGKTKANIKAFMPNFVKDYTRAFKNPGKMSAGQVSAMMKTIGSSMTAIDSKWDKWVAPGDKELLNMNMCMKGSTDFQTAIKRTAQATPVTRIPSPGASDAGVKFLNDTNTTMTAVMNMFSSDKSSPKKQAYVKSDGSNNLGLFGMGVYIPKGLRAPASLQVKQSKPAVDSDAAEQLKYEFGDVML